MPNNTDDQIIGNINIGRASKYLGVSIDTLRRWEKKGRIEPTRSPGGHRYFIKEELDKLQNKRYTRDIKTPQSQTTDQSDTMLSGSLAEPSIQITNPLTASTAANTSPYNETANQGSVSSTFEVSPPNQTANSANTISPRPVDAIAYTPQKSTIDTTVPTFENITTPVNNNENEAPLFPTNDVLISTDQNARLDTILKGTTKKTDSFQTGLVVAIIIFLIVDGVLLWIFFY